MTNQEPGDDHIAPKELINVIAELFVVNKEELVVRTDGRVEWICEHGVGHPLYSPLAYGGAYSHGCCGCCSDGGISPSHFMDNEDGAIDVVLIPSMRSDAKEIKGIIDKNGSHNYPGMKRCLNSIFDSIADMRAILIKRQVMVLLEKKRKEKESKKMPLKSKGR